MRHGCLKTINDIPEQYRVQQQGIHNQNVYMCFACSRDLQLQDLIENFIGFAENTVDPERGGIYIIYTCPTCRRILYHHASDIVINIVLNIVQDNHN